MINDNSLHLVVKEGYLNIKENASNEEYVFLKDVYHVLGIKKNLAYVSQITNSRSYILFGSDDVKVLSKVKHIIFDVLLIGKKKESLYMLSTSDAYVERIGQNSSTTL